MYHLLTVLNGTCLTGNKKISYLDYRRQKKSQDKNNIEKNVNLMPSANTIIISNK